MQGGFWDASEYGESGGIETVPVRCEYPGSHRFDIAIIDPATVRLYDKDRWKMEGLKNDAFSNQPILAAVEIKYCQLGDSSRLRIAEAAADIEKLKMYLEQRGKHPFLGISMTFIMPANVPAEFMEGTKLDNEPKSGLARYVVSRGDWFKYKP